MELKADGAANFTITYPNGFTPTPYYSTWNYISDTQINLDSNLTTIDEISDSSLIVTYMVKVPPTETYEITKTVNYKRI